MEINISNLTLKNNDLKINNVFEQMINDQLKMIINVDLNKDKIYVDVYEVDFNQKFQPFYTNDISSYAANIKEMVNNNVEKFISDNFYNVDLKLNLINYCVEQFQAKIDNPWEKYPTFTTVKNKQDKWFALFMDIPLNKLNKKENKDIIDVLNIKLDPIKIEKLINDKNFFKAYHMNHKHWISILLNKNIDENYVKELIAESYNLILKK